jgi:hypothetical protein
MQVPVYALPMLALSLLIGVAVVIAVCRADRQDLPAIIQALMRMGPPTNDQRKGPPSLPKPRHHDRDDDGDDPLSLPKP